MARYEVCWESSHRVVVEVPEGATSDEIIDKAWDCPDSVDEPVIANTTTIRRLDKKKEETRIVMYLIDNWKGFHGPVDIDSTSKPRMYLAITRALHHECGAFVACRIGSRCYNAFVGETSWLTDPSVRKAGAYDGNILICGCAESSESPDRGLKLSSLTNEDVENIEKNIWMRPGYPYELEEVAVLHIRSVQRGRRGRVPEDPMNM